jgi:putative ABC transport system permease protein
MKYHGESLDSVSVRGVTREYITLPSTTIERGRPITPGEFDAGSAVALLGWGTADRLFGALDPLEKLLTIGGVHFRVIGVAPKKGSILGNSQDEWAVIPLRAYQRIFGTRQSLELTVRPVDPSLVQTAMDDARVALRIERRLRPKQPDNFGILSADTFLNLYNSATSLIFTVLIGVVSLSLVVGGIVIMNIMLMVVTERTREIGLRKSLGARRRDVMWQILTESITLSTFGGLVGTTLGFLVAYVISQLSPLPAVVETWSVVLGITMTAVVGLFFGMYPAMRAAKLDPIEALRRE